MKRENSTQPIYQETQFFRQPWIWALVLCISLISIYGAVQQLILGKPFGNNPAPDTVMVIIAVIFGLGLPAFMFMMNLAIEVREDGLYIRFSPFHLSFHKIALEDIKEFQARTYNPIKEYGGWGIRYGRNGKAYNVRGNRGVQLQLTSGRKLLIGSQKPEELAEALAIISGTKQQ